MATQPRTYRISDDVAAELARLAKIHGGIDKALREVLSIVSFSNPLITPLDELMEPPRCEVCDKPLPLDAKFAVHSECAKPKPKTFIIEWGDTSDTPSGILRQSYPFHCPKCGEEVLDENYGHCIAVARPVKPFKGPLLKPKERK